jgi:hypothetical protein
MSFCVRKDFYDIRMQTRHMQGWSASDAVLRLFIVNLQKNGYRSIRGRNLFSNSDQFQTDSKSYPIQINNLK